MSTPPMKHPPELPDWEQRYRDQSVETMPWYYASLDPDFERALTQLGIRSGKARTSGPLTASSPLAGSLAANLHRGLDGVTLANVAQFRSMPEFRAWVSHLFEVAFVQNDDPDKPAFRR